MILVDPNKPVYRGNTHTHTQNSDGRKSFDEALDIYAALGHDFLVVTDHWKIGPETRRGKMLVMSGIEYDFLDVPNQALHVVGILPGGADPGLDREKDNRDYNYALCRINEVGGAAVLAHPHWSLNTLDVMKNVGDVVGAEVYNAVSGLPFGPDRAVSTAQLDVAAANGRLFRFLCGDDTHYYLSEPGSGFTMVQADECTPEGIIAALKRGSFYCTQGPLVHPGSPGVLRGLLPGGHGGVLYRRALGPRPLRGGKGHDPRGISRGGSGSLRALRGHRRFRQTGLDQPRKGLNPL